MYVASSKQHKIGALEKEREAKLTVGCTFAPKITAKVPDSSKLIRTQDALEARDAIDVDAVFNYHWNKMFNHDAACKVEDCQKFVKICVDEIGRKDKKEFDEGAYKLKMAGLKDLKKP